MSVNPLAAKIAAPYARAFYDYSVGCDKLFKVTADFQNIDILLKIDKKLMSYLKNPLISKELKKEILDKIFKKKVNEETLKLLKVLVNRDRINLFDSITTCYLKLVYKLAEIKRIEVDCAVTFKFTQRRKLLNKIRALTNTKEIQLVLDFNPSLIGGFLIKTDSKIIDFTIKNKLQKLSKHLDSVLDI